MAHHHGGAGSSSSTSSTSGSSEQPSVMEGMSAIFYSSQATSLYSAAWTPGSTAGYAATCIFLIFLAFVLRFLFSAKHVLERRWCDKEHNRRQVAVRGKKTLAQAVRDSPEAQTGTLIMRRRSAQSEHESVEDGPKEAAEETVEESVRIVKSSSREVMPWRFSTELPRAALMTVIVGVAYLL